jgi:hypothetical protein
MPSICLRGIERGQQVQPVCLVRILLKGTHGRQVTRNVHDCTWHGWGYSLQPPPTPRQGRACTLAIVLHGLTWRGPNDEHDSICWTWAMVVCNIWLHLMVGRIWLPPLPSSRSCTHVTICPLKNQYLMLGFLLEHCTWAIIRVIMWHNTFGVGGGICQDPPHPRLGHARKPAFWPTWA